MARYGYPSATDPYQFAALAWPATRPTDEERKAAVQDVACKSEVNFVQTGLAIEYEVLAELEPAYIDALTKVAVTAQLVGYDPSA
jgi:hypothetical protein